MEQEKQDDVDEWLWQLVEVDEKLILKTYEEYKIDNPNASYKEYLKAYHKIWRTINKDKVKQDGKIRLIKWRKDNPEKRKEAGRKRYYKNRRKLIDKKRNFELKRKYGLTLEKLADLKILQDNKCAICGTNTPGEKGLHIDHCHKTGKVRKLLCGKCNRGIGNFKENIEIMLKAIQYLKDHR